MCLVPSLLFSNESRMSGIAVETVWTLMSRNVQNLLKCLDKKLKEYLLDAPLPLNQQPSDYNWEHPDLIHHDSLVDRAENFISYTTGVINISSVQQLSLKAMFYLISGILGSVNVDLVPVLFQSRTELSIGSGTGSSASFLVSLAAALVQYVKIKCGTLGNFSKSGYKWSGWEVGLDGFSEKELEIICKWALYAEMIIHGRPSGIDNTICTYGSMVEFRKGLPPKLLQTEQPFRLLLINTGVPRATKTLVSKVAHLHERYPDMVENILRAMEDVAFLALQYYTSLCAALAEQGDQITPTVRECYEELGRLTSINHDLLSALGVSHVKLDEAVLVLSQNGLHGKLTGAGGGGYAISLLPPYVDQGVVDEVTRVLVTAGFEVILTELGGCGVTVE